MMPGVELSDIARAVDAPLRGKNALVTSVGIDSRHCKPGQLFVALQGQQVDGHDYLEDAKRAGACGAMVERAQTCALAQIEVSNCERSLASVASFNRDLYTGKVLGITGSAGKTACKNILASILSQRYVVHATRGNLNNELGLPLTVLELEPRHDLAVLEMGAAKPGDIAYLAKIARPEIGLVTNVSEAHLGGFGSVETTAKTKGELFDSLPENGIAVMNRDDRFFDAWYQRFCQRRSADGVWSFSLCDAQADFFTDSIQLLPNGSRFTIKSTRLASSWRLDVLLPLLGEHNIINAVACVALCKSMGLDDTLIEQGLAAVTPESHRLQYCESCTHLHLYDDSYNANPASMLAALETVANLQALQRNDAAPAERVAVFGDMAELGDGAAQLHQEVGAAAAALGYTQLLAVGDFAESYVAGFEANGGKRGEVADSIEALANILGGAEYAAATVLLKGSRAAGMDKLAELLCRPVSGGPASC
ncbi:MAG: UDP-N-acetylmuramoyl-tripeptide--D-alanyl-D-alanine ligase [Gammaproteobacteria bacterium]|nr:UDP-N-acetylmuramoyl-tripeptide--D-alanyl-D-alanine ligase [Gammaproteobacteria bacterium]MBT8151030.1 UDP-N-acetylmuramoyl-tripeptide--D-alanyl-D-alanine ligase [Gammaproteobacteria bacterium]NNM11676.1 UDP-N-acetylmuramoyl-tripeptide--D-alanyl-D-alanine ligase [Pseudomonadales bacterium]RZV51464.1 MAG: UDP-N-acetylmuramoyl-tripeptide--D-alanyl-D-alanine ligase [Pseudomonadales bacterium]